MKRLTQLISITLVLMLLFSSMAFSAYAESFVPSNKSVIYFEVPADWEGYTNIYCHVWGGDGDYPFANWLSKKELCTETETTGVYSYNITEKTGKTLKEGITYCVIFADDTGNQTHSTIFSTECFGDTLYCDGTEYDTPSYQGRTYPAAFWKHQNPREYGPLLETTSTGSFIGTALPKGVTAEDIFRDFLTHHFEAAQLYSGKTDQQIIDDAIAYLEIPEETVAQILKGNDNIDWSYAGDNEIIEPSATNPSYDPDFTPSEEPVIYFEVPADWENYIKIYCHVWEFDGGDPFANWLSKKELCTETETSGVYSYNITEKTGKALKEGIPYCVIFADDTGNETFETLFSTDCFGDTLYCDGTKYYTPEYSLRISPAAFWKHQNPVVCGPLKRINAIGNIIGTALPKGITDEDLFVSFLTDSLDDARFFSGYPDQWILEDTLYSLDVTVDVAVETICNMGIYMLTGRHISSVVMQI